MNITLTPQQIKAVEKHIQKDLWNTVSAEEILIPYETTLTKGGKILTKEEILSLKDGAVTILALNTWRQLVTDMKFSASQRMFESSQSFDDMRYGKAMLFCIDVMEKKLRSLAQLKVDVEK